MKLIDAIELVRSKKAILIVKNPIRKGQKPLTFIPF